ncbi:unnamed protein product [Mucor circinelloides]
MSLTSLLHKHQKTLTDISFWSCHVPQTLSFKLFVNLARLCLSGIYIKEEWLDIAMDTILGNARLQQFRLGRLSLSQPNKDYHLQSPRCPHFIQPCYTKQHNTQRFFARMSKTDSPITGELSFFGLLC